MNLIKNMEAFFVATALCGLTLAWVADENITEQQVASTTQMQTASLQHVAPAKGAQA